MTSGDFGSEYDFDTLRRMASQRIKTCLRPKREMHSRAVAAEAVRLAQKYGADMRKAEIAGLLHDVARHMPADEMNDMVRNLGLDDRYLDNPNLAHGKIAVAILKGDFGISDTEILDAVSYHTTGRDGMTLLDMIIFLADADEPGRQYPGVDKLRELADIDLWEACAYSLERTINYVNSRGEYLDPDTARALEYCKRERIRI